jgi:DNA polymerase-3 subunit delta
MLLKAQGAARSLTTLNPAIRLYVLGGPDESLSRSLMATIARSVGKDAERIDFTPAKLKDDPALLADEAASISMFGGPRWICVTLFSGGGDDVLPAVENLLASPAAGNPVVVIGGSLTAKSKLVKLAEKDPAALAVIAYAPNAEEAGRLAEDMGAAAGMTLSRDVARAIASATSGDQGLMAQEIAKLALFVDAAPGDRVDTGIDAWRAIGADLPEEDVGAAVTLVFEGRLGDLPDLFLTLQATGVADIRLVRSLATRALLLARLRGLVDDGQSPRQVVEAQGKAIFWKEKDGIIRQLGKWDSPRLARLIERLHRLERELKSPMNAETLLLRHALTDIARVAASSR